MGKQKAVKDKNRQMQLCVQPLFCVWVTAKELGQRFRAVFWLPVHPGPWKLLAVVSCLK